MFKGKELYRFSTMIIALSMLLSTSAFASLSTKTSREQAIINAKEFLTSYKEVRTNEYGKDYTVEYIFENEQDLNKIATYIADNGIDNFNKSLNAAINRAVSKERQTYALTPRTTTPTEVYVTVYGNGTHTIYGEASGLASFDTLGTVEYGVEMSYRVTAGNGELSNLNSISFNVFYISGGGSYSDMSFPSYCSGAYAGVTANYTISKSLELDIGGVPVVIRTETDNEIFAVLANLQ